VGDLLGLKTTPLTTWHRAKGAKMVPYAGYEMPVQYEGVLAEHAAVRESVGLFDITHMGEIFVTGPAAESWLDGLITNRISGAAVGKITYTAMCREDGGVLDDMLIYRLAEERWMVVCNAANHEKIINWMTSRIPSEGVVMKDATAEVTLIAVQGPTSQELLCRLGALQDVVGAIKDLDFYTGLELAGPSGQWIVSRTGYTGEHGYELYLPNAAALAAWEELIKLGADLQVAPIGLAARDTLRFEVCYCLYGHELTEDISPLEAGIGWAMRLKKDHFVGREALAAQKANGVPRKIICLEITGRGIARQDAKILHDGREVGFVTSGTFSPSFQKPIAMALVERDTPEGELVVDVRGREIACQTVKFPFMSARTKGDPSAVRDLP
jgi:aminomethyltransferase